MEIHFEIENKCLLRCRHCSSFATDSGEIMNYTIKDMISFLKLFSEEKHIFLTGGEPLLNEELNDILYSINNEFADVSLGVFTTGIVRKQGNLESISFEQAKDYASLGLKVCYFSLYSAKPEEHDWMTGINGSFKLTLKSIEQMKNQNIEGKVNLVITKRNIEEIDDIIDLAVSIGCTEVRFLKLINHGRATNCWSGIGITEQEYVAYVKKYVNAYKNINITASGCTDILPCRPFKDAHSCQAGSKLAYVTYEGDVFPCASTKNNPYYKIGNLAEITTLKQYFDEKKFTNKIALCKC